MSRLFISMSLKGILFVLFVFLIFLYIFFLFWGLMSLDCVLRFVWIIVLMFESFVVEIDLVSFVRLILKLNLCVNFKERCIVILLKIENDVVDEL